jgi:hypothetical protein
VAPSIDTRTYRPHWSQRTRLTMLLEEGAIDRDVFAAGVTLRGWCETAIRGLRTQSWDVPINNGGGRPGAANDIELAAARRLQAVASALGREWFVVLEMTVIDDLSSAYRRRPRPDVQDREGTCSRGVADARRLVPPGSGGAGAVRIRQQSTAVD